MAYRMQGKIEFRCHKKVEDDFYEYCDNKEINPPEILRTLLSNWLERKQREDARQNVERKAMKKSKVG